MATCRIGVLSSGWLDLYSWSGACLTPPLTFEATTAGRARFAEHLRLHAPRPIHLLVDAVEEEFREETVPHVHGADRQALLRTRIRRLFNDAQYHHTVVQAREVSGRRDDRVLFSALTRADLLSSWLQPIIAQDIPLVGVSSLPLMTEQLLAWQRIKEESVLMITLQRSGSLRQSFFRHGKLRISRLAALPRMESVNLAVSIQHEIDNIRQYLNSLQLTSDNTPLPVVVLGSDSIRDDLMLLAEAGDSLYRTRYIFLSVKETVRQLGARDLSGTHVIDTESADVLFALWAYKKGVANHYATADHTHRYRIDRIKRGLLAASILMLVSCLGYAGMRVLDGVTATSETTVLKRQTERYDTLYQQAKDTLPSLPLAPFQLREVVQLATALEQRRADPIDMIQIISRGLAEVDELRLRKFIWKTSPDPKAAIEEQDPTNALVTTPPAADTSPDSDRLYQIALIEGEVQGYSDYRYAMERISYFADVLRADPAIEYVEVLSLPLRLGSQQPADDHTADPLPYTGFQLKLARRMVIPNAIHSP